MDSLTDQHDNLFETLIQFHETFSGDFIWFFAWGRLAMATRRPTHFFSWIRLTSTHFVQSLGLSRSKLQFFRETSTSTHFDEKSTFFFMNSSYFDALWSLFNLLASKLFRETSTFTCLDSLRLILFNLFLFLQSKFRGDGDFGELNVD